MNERRWLQVAVCVACIVPLGAGAAGITLGSSFPGWIDNTALRNLALDSHVRYLSGLLLAIGIAFLSTVPKIDTQSVRFQLLTFVVFMGGLARLAGIAVTGMPPVGMIFGLFMEVVVTPLLCLWQLRVSRGARELF